MTVGVGTHRFGNTKRRSGPNNPNFFVPASITFNLLEDRKCNVC